MSARAKTKQLQIKLSSTAMIEIKLLNAFHRSAKRVIQAALHSCASRRIHGKIELIGFAAQNFSSLMAFTSVVWRARKRETRIGSPTATSAAANVLLKKANTGSS